MAEKAQLHEHLFSVVVGEHKAACSRLGGQKTGIRVQTLCQIPYCHFSFNLG